MYRCPRFCLLPQATQLNLLKLLLRLTHLLPPQPLRDFVKSVINFSDESWTTYYLSKLVNSIDTENKDHQSFVEYDKTVHVREASVSTPLGMECIARMKHFCSSVLHATDASNKLHLNPIATSFMNNKTSTSVEHATDVLINSGE